MIDYARLTALGCDVVDVRDKETWIVEDVKALYGFDRSVDLIEQSFGDETRWLARIRVNGDSFPERFIFAWDDVPECAMERLHDRVQRVLRAVKKSEAA